MLVIGTQQSPIKLETAKAIFTPLSTGHLSFKYSKPLRGKIDPAKHNFVFDLPADENNAIDWSMTVRGVTWIIQQIHLHADAEHLVDSDTAKPFEVHLVHSAPGDKQAERDKVVVGVFIRPGKETREKKSLEKFADQLAKRARDSSGPEPSEVNPDDFLPDSAYDRFFRYEGSLTGEPYTEDVSWYVMKEEGVVEQPKFDALHEHAKHQPREVQFTNRRYVLKSFEK